MNIANFQLWVTSRLHDVDPIFTHLQDASRELELFQMRVYDTESLAKLIVVFLSDTLNDWSVHETALICTCKYQSPTILSPIACYQVSLEHMRLKLGRIM